METNIFIHVSVVQILLDKWEKICLVYVTNMKKKKKLLDLTSKYRDFIWMFHLKFALKTIMDFYLENIAFNLQNISILDSSLIL
jgi:hypothetical protein